MWRLPSALIVSLVLTALVEASVLADSHLAATSGAAGTAPVTAVPRAGIGITPNHTWMLMALVGLIALCVIGAVVTATQPRRV